ncbi:HalOD1 output domain-containing protein [Haloplanus halophilus]|uniref:HalOD1 output domain-containing protein n=1 Tax=Haloplanus halophilus TaxID=2949993 RepID=UPI002040A26A|nr:HalOD1 output domain-containing protein [Haloplanus sp. GDY1]
MQENSHTESDVTTYDPATGTYTVDYSETSDIELSVTVVHAVLEATGKEPTEVNLNDAIQPDALNRLFGDKHDGTPRSGGTLTFAFAGCEVTVTGDGEIRVDPDP